MFDAMAVGELLIDFTPDGVNDQGMTLFARNPGGAPANVMAMVARLGGRTSFIGKVGRDVFGKFLSSKLASNGVDVSGLIVTSEANTTLAIVQLDEKGDRSFSFYRKPGADMLLDESEISREQIEGCRIFHFGSVSLTDEPSRSATIQAAKLAKNAGKLISFDPNYRSFLWDTQEHAKTEILKALTYADLVKVSEEELLLLTGNSDLADGAKRLLQYGPKVILVSLGSKGAFFFTASSEGILPTYDVKTIDTTGAGDAFTGAVLFRLSNRTEKDLNDIAKSEWMDIVDFANAAGSLTTAKKGAIPAMPTMDEIKKCQKEIPLLKVKIKS